MDRVSAFLREAIESIGIIDVAYMHELCVSAFVLFQSVACSIWKGLIYIAPKTWQDMGALATILAFIASGFAAWFACKSFQTALDSLRQEKIKNKDAVLCEEAIECLRLAHETLISERDEGMPAPNRFNWLTAARLIDM
ncbi:hypothetical protein JOS77_30755 [Chromobacterium haemolyticum]|nr:hypothetical protein JOS77_30755 [Chromobacterium haemolyticum]